MAEETEEYFDLVLKFKSEVNRNELAQIIASSDKVSVEYDEDNHVLIIPEIN